ncbi:MAG: hypothetical protein AAF829_00905 [Pseudomonadota bacterium]
MIRIVLATSALAFLAACASSTTDPLEPAIAIEPPIEAADLADNPFSLAMATVSSLKEAGNEQTAIDRLTQLLGDESLGNTERVLALETRADLRAGDGNDVFGAIEDYSALLDMDGLTADQTVAYTEARDVLNGEATSLNFLLDQGNLSRTEQFETLFRLGQHQDAMDYVLANGLTPSNDYLVDMYQMGFLCEGDEYGGPVYNATEPDGTPRALQYCDFGK